MSTDPKRDWTVIVMRPGTSSRHYVVGPLRRGFAVSMCVLVPLGTLVLGYRLGTQGGLPMLASQPPAGAAATDHIAASQDGLASEAEPGFPAAEPRAAGDPAEDPELGLGGEALGEARGEGEAEDGDSASGEDALDLASPQEAESLGPELALQMDLGGGQVMKLHPFTESGKALRDAFTQLRNAMACEDGRVVTPSARLAKLLVETHQNFNRPLLILGGHCGGHDDQLEATVQHTAGRAADIRIRGVSTGRLTEWLEGRQDVTGIGRYKRKGFVHVDVRPGERVAWDPDEATQSSTTRRKARADEQKPSESAEASTPTPAPPAATVTAVAPPPAPPAVQAPPVPEAPKAVAGAEPTKTEAAP